MTSSGNSQLNTTKTNKDFNTRLLKRGVMIQSSPEFSGLVYLLKHRYKRCLYMQGHNRPLYSLKSDAPQHILSHPTSVTHLMRAMSDCGRAFQKGHQQTFIHQLQNIKFSEEPCAQQHTTENGRTNGGTKAICEVCFAPTILSLNAWFISKLMLNKTSDLKVTDMSFQLP